MAVWDDGYVSEIGYLHGYFRELAPRVMQIASGIEMPIKTYCELGCGQGFSANLLAAANPDIQFYATDFNPSQIAGALALARDAALPNVRFFDDSFAEFHAREDLPTFDVIALHGIYSWIAPEHRRTIVEFIDKRLNPGGLVYISYNCLPGWAAAAPMRELLRLSGSAAAGTILDKLNAGLDFLERVGKTGARYFSVTPGLDKRLKGLREQNPNYLAHEYLNRDWHSFYHSDVAEELSAARLQYAASASFIDHVDAINLTSEQQALLRETKDTTLRETYRDFLINQQFRRDIFARGRVALALAESKEIWLNTRLALSTAREDITLKVQGALGEASLQEEVYGPLLDALAKPIGSGKSASLSLRQLLSDHPDIANFGWTRIQQALLVLLGAGHLQPCHADYKEEASRRKRTDAFNKTVCARARYSADLQFLASPVTGGGIPVDRFQQLYLHALGIGESDPAAFVWKILSDQGQKIIKEGQVIDTDEGNLAELRDRYASFQKRLPTLKSLGIV